ncbi:hypothetical protein C8A05DRAFT_33551 [Staphylotrichum tortipilum]|uniref:ADP-ribose 1''-phosphate phosphatase n=1 Tax=Staphylotrichum tortipilum TaxID=2831512 RepID=A0AAN6MM07_9PEZI|nr:hypothetical protein C8A05DRAFT_33551 [Staphylotrichum longicolle]
MSGKRPAPQGGPRQHKQTKLDSFFSAASRPKKPSPAEEEAQPGPVETTKAQASEAINPTQPVSPSTNTTPKQTPTTTLTTSTPRLPPTTIHITHHTGDIFSAPPATLLIHACNTVGSWGGGIALAFRARYPSAYGIYRAHCLRSTPNQLIGTALLIPPPVSAQGKEKALGHYIGCLFTSRRYGKTRDSVEEILAATGPAVRELMGMVARLEREGKGRVGAVRMCKINSGLFAVPWEESQRVVEEEVVLGEGEVPGCAVGGCVEVEVWDR